MSDNPAKPQILIVDDEAYRTRLYRQKLQEAGYEVRFSSTIDEACDALDDPDFKPVLLIQDMQMGRPESDSKHKVTDAELQRFNGLSGLWFLVNRRGWLQNRKIPAIILTQRGPGEFIEIVDVELRQHQVPVRIRRKFDTAAAMLSVVVKEFLGDVKRGTLE